MIHIKELDFFFKRESYGFHHCDVFTAITHTHTHTKQGGSVSVMATKCLLLPMFDSTLPPNLSVTLGK